MLSSTCIPLVLLDINYFTFTLSVLGVFYSTFNSLAPLHNLYFTFTPLVLRSHSICIFRGVSNPPLFFFSSSSGASSAAQEDTRRCPTCDRHWPLPLADVMQMLAPEWPKTGNKTRCTSVSRALIG